jgi:hypothetical protein
MNREETLSAIHPDGERMVTEAAADHIATAREFLERSMAYLNADDLHQASEKGWGAAAHMVKAVAITNGNRGEWRYESHQEFSAVVEHIALSTNNDRLLLLAGRAEALHVNYYRRKPNLRRQVIEKDIERVAEFLNILVPLASSPADG